MTLVWAEIFIGDTNHKINIDKMKCLIIKTILLSKDTLNKTKRKGAHRIK